MSNLCSGWHEDHSIPEPYLMEEPLRADDYGCGPVFEFQGCWFDLYKDMNPDELDVFNSILQSDSYDRQTHLMNQGVPSQRLYFINQGQAETVVMEKGARFVGPVLGLGDVVGADTFFNGEKSKRSVMALKGTRVDYLEKEDVLEAFAYVPGLIGKLKTFCMKRENDMQAIRMETMEKRTQKRYAISGLTAAKLLDTEGIPTGKPFRGELLDISEGGFSFLVRLAEEQVARRLQGRSIVSLIKIQQSRPGEDVFWGGRIVKVRRLNDANYSVHLKGDVTSRQVSTMIRNLSD